MNLSVIAEDGDVDFFAFSDSFLYQGFNFAVEKDVVAVHNLMFLLLYFILGIYVFFL